MQCTRPCNDLQALPCPMTTKQRSQDYKPNTMSINGAHSGRRTVQPSDIRLFHKPPHGGAQLVSGSKFGKNGRRRASEEYRFITSPPHKGVALLLWPSQAVLRPGTAGTTGVAGTAVVVSSCLTTTPSGYCSTDLLLVLNYCRGCWFCCPAAVVANYLTTTPSGYCCTADTSLLPGLLVLLNCCGRLKLPDDHALRLLLYCGYFFTAVVVSNCPRPDTAVLLYCRGYWSY